jgi:hypothetical protein
MKPIRFILLVFLFGTGCGEGKDAVLTDEATDRYIEQLHAAVYVDGRPDLNLLTEFALTHPDRERLCEYSNLDYEGRLGELFLLHASKDLHPEQQAEFDALRKIFISVAGTRQP